MKLDLYMIQSATQRAKDYADDTVKRVTRLLKTDRDKAKRGIVGYCKWCWYRRSVGLAGQAFTEYTCRRCDSVAVHESTAVPALCRDCVKTTGLCAGCCGDINGEKRSEVP